MLCHSSYLSFIPMSPIAFRNVRLRMRRLFYVWISIGYYQLLSIILTHFDINKHFAHSFDFSKSLIYFSAKPNLSTDFEKIFYLFCGGHSAKLRIAFKTNFVHHISLKYFLFRVDIFCTRVYPFRARLSTAFWKYFWSQSDTPPVIILAASSFVHRFAK